MGHVVDRWTTPGPNGRRIRNDRYGRGKRWVARWVDPGGRERWRSCVTKDEALTFLAHVAVDRSRGTYVGLSKVTFREYLGQWLDAQLHQRPQTTASARSKLERYAVPEIGHLPMQAVTRADVQRVVSSAEALGPAARRVLFAWVRAVFNSAVEDRLISTSPCRKVNLPVIEKRQAEPLTPAQVSVIAERVRPGLQAMVWLGAGTGLRPGELRALTADRVVNGRVLVDRQLAEGSNPRRPAWGPLKNAASRRTVALAPITLTMLEQHLAEHPLGPEQLIFTSIRGTALRRSHLSDAWSRAVEGLALGTRSGWHELRHHHASLLIAGGASPRAVAERLGHADPSETLRTYAHLWPGDDDRMVQSVQNAYGRPRGVDRTGLVES